MTLRIGLAVSLLFFAVEHLHAGADRVNVRGMGMARSYVASAKGLDAIGINPANLAVKDYPFSISIAPAGVHAGSDFLTLGLYNDYFTGVETSEGRVGKYLAEPDKQRILDAFRNDVGEVSADAAVRLLGVSFQIPSIGGFAFTITDQIAGRATVPQDFVRFALYGNTPGSSFDFSQTSARVSWLRMYAISFGGALPPPAFMQWLSIGASIKIVQGYGHYEIDRFNTSLVTAENGVLTGRVSYLSRLAGLDPTKENSGFTIAPFGMQVFGYGAGFDLGVAGGIGTSMTVGLSFTDIGKVNWEDRIEETYADTSMYIDDISQVQEGSAIRNALNGKKRKGNPFSTLLPTTFRLGVAVNVDKVVGWMPGELLVAADYNQGLTDAAGSTLYGRFSLGMEWKPVPYLPLRSGISFGGTDRMNVALGFGVNVAFFELDVATENLNFLWMGDNMSHGSVALGTRFRF